MSDDAELSQNRPIPTNLRSVFTESLPNILRQLNISLAVTTYQAGKIILVREDEGVINTHFRNFRKPMGLIEQNGRLTIGGEREVVFLRNMPAVAQKLEPAGKYDACYLPRRTHFTGDIDIHDIDWGVDNDLWIVNTRFSCLCTLDPDHSFVPRWRPHFVTQYAPEDRCHLNGLGMKDGHPQFVTALGETDTAGGWRENKANGGLLMDVPSNEIIMRGLSMPHSPRWHNDMLWLLESGEGRIGIVDLDKGSLSPIIELPGFTRGIDFYGPLAFVGLSKVRETAVFSGIPITERLTERICGVWVVNVQTAQTVGFLRFEEGVEEIFAVQVLPNTRFPEIIEANHKLLPHAYVLPDEALADVPDQLRNK